MRGEGPLLVTVKRWVVCGPSCVRLMASWEGGFTISLRLSVSLIRASTLSGAETLCLGKGGKETEERALCFFRVDVELEDCSRVWHFLDGRIVSVVLLLLSF